jgi:hypothetical protein
MPRHETPSPNVTLRAVRIYGSDSWWGEPRTSPTADPVEVHDVPTAGAVASIFFGKVPEQISEQIQARNALAEAILTRIFGGTEFASVDDAVAARLDSEDPPAYDENAWYLTLVFDRPAYIPEDPERQSTYVWWDVQAAEQIDRPFRKDASEVFDVLAAHTSLVLGADFFEHLVTEPDYSLVLRSERPVSFVPLLRGGVGKISVGRGPAADFPAPELQTRIGSLTAQAWKEHTWLRRAVDWYVASLTTTDEWRRFQSLWFALELLTNKLAGRHRDDVLSRLRYAPDIDTNAAVCELAWSENRAPLAAKFAVMALALAPETANRDLEAFKNIKEGRDAMSHGQLTDPAQLLTGQLVDLVRRYLDLGLRSLLP